MPDETSDGVGGKIVTLNHTGGRGFIGNGIFMLEGAHAAPSGIVISLTVSFIFR